MDCSHFRSNIIAFREGALPEASMNSATLHLASCRACTRLVSTFRELDEIIGHEKSSEPNPFAATRILQRIENEFSEHVKPVPPLWIRMLQPVSLAVALLCGILIGSYTAKKDNAIAVRPENTPENIEILRSNLFISEITDEDKVLVLNK